MAVLALAACCAAKPTAIDNFRPRWLANTPDFKPVTAITFLPAPDSRILFTSKNGSIYIGTPDTKPFVYDEYFKLVCRLSLM